MLLGAPAETNSFFSLSCGDYLLHRAQQDWMNDLVVLTDPTCLEILVLISMRSCWISAVQRSKRCMQLKLLWPIHHPRQIRGSSWAEWRSEEGEFTGLVLHWDTLGWRYWPRISAVRKEMRFFARVYWKNREVNGHFAFWYSAVVWHSNCWDFFCVEGKTSILFMLGFFSFSFQAG